MASPNWKELPKEHNLAKFLADLPEILQSTGHSEMYGVHLEAATETYGKNVASSIETAG